MGWGVGGGGAGREDMKRRRIKANGADRASEDVTMLRLLSAIEEDPAPQLQGRLGGKSAWVGVCVPFMATNNEECFEER